MTTNSVFNKFQETVEQNILDDLMVEAIQIKGQDTKYLPREVIGTEDILGEDRVVRYTNAYDIEMYLDNPESYEGEGKIYDKFGFGLDQHVIFEVSRTRFEAEVTANAPTRIKPREGDLIYFPLDHSLYEILDVDPYQRYFQHGSLYLYRITCERYTYTNDKFNTGVSGIDQYEDDYGIADESSIDSEIPFADNDLFDNDVDNVLDFTEIDPFGEID